MLKKVQADYSQFLGVYNDTNTIRIPELSEFVAKAVELVDKTKLRLVETEEFIIDTLCQLREEYGLEGLRLPGHIVQAQNLETCSIFGTKRFSSKLRLMEVLRKLSLCLGIPTASFHVLHLKPGDSIATHIDALDAKVSSLCL